MPTPAPAPEPAADWKSRKRRHPKPKVPKVSSGLKIAGGLYAIVVLAIVVGLYQVISDRQEPLPPPVVAVTQKSAAPTPEEIFEANEPAPPAAATISDDIGAESATQPVAQPPQAVKGVPAWRRNAMASVMTNAPKLAIVIDDLGLQENATDDLIAIPGPITLAFLPYAENLAAQTRRAHHAGHELLVHLPMEPAAAGYDPGPNALLSGLSKDEFKRRIDWNLSRFDGFVGINNHMGSGLTARSDAMAAVMTALKARGLLFLDSLTTSKSQGAREAALAGVPYARRDVFLDNVRDPKAILKQLAEAERRARSHGSAIAIGHPYPETIQTLREWRKGLEARGFVLVPLSQLVQEETTARAEAARAANVSR
ncbi:divergent polysaccharide deacetylase family protein [Gimibacter soli]|uniref:Divergent polysaccharide deacetylase family protein n=1 Tax=Gimibacter soli TaxID=3024400 RepID=A0AAE9XKP6_9PROT|nr:divergent polysaccharide deacetylase family protein [Gimibacter soli]WCL52954.1 divergent polysaccharide deacetylase family protein [Gimibacter soli]